MATRDIALGELICLERPLNRGPKPSTEPVCLGCYVPLQSASALCPEGCGWPVCSVDCPHLLREHKSECEHFRRRGFNVQVGGNACTDWSKWILQRKLTYLYDILEKIKKNSSSSMDNMYFNSPVLNPDQPQSRVEGIKKNSYQLNSIF